MICISISNNLAQIVWKSSRLANATLEASFQFVLFTDRSTLLLKVRTNKVANNCHTKKVMTSLKTHLL